MNYLPWASLRAGRRTVGALSRMGNSAMRAVPPPNLDFVSIR
jgi:hypothetical protein